MRICVLTTSYPRAADDDAGIFVKRLVDAYSAQGAQGFVVVPHDKDEPLTAQEGTFKIQRYRYGIFSAGRLAFGAGVLPNLRVNPWLILQAPFLLLRMLWCAISLRGSYDVLHANWCMAGLVAWMAALLTGKPYLISVRGEDVRFSRPLLLRLLLMLPFKQAAGIVSVNDSFLGELRERYHLSSQKLCTIPNGVEVQPPSADALMRFCQRSGLQPQAKYLLFVGTIIPRKRVTILIDLLSRPEMADYSLILCGRIDDEQCVQHVQAYAKNCGVQSRLHITGKVSPAEVPYFLSLARCYVSASEFEGRSNSVLEACAARLPVCLSDISAHRELISSAGGFLFTEIDLGAAAAFILRLDGDAAFREQITKQAYEIVQGLSWEMCAGRYLELLGRACG